jgi:flagellar basal-body rod modification protein FlgD
MTTVNTSSPISPLSAVTQSIGASATPDKTTLGKDDFLKLLMAQMQNQDPTQPADSNQFVAQLAQFSEVEQLTSMNSSMTSMLYGQAAAAQTAAASLVGKDVVYRSDSVTLTAGQPVAGQGQLASDAATVAVQVTDSNGKVVRTIQLGAEAAGKVTYSWDGRDDAGNTLPPGTYSIKINAADSKGNAVAAEQRATGVVSGIAFDSSGAPLLLVNGQQIAMKQVAEIDQP